MNSHASNDTASVLDQDASTTMTELDNETQRILPTTSTSTSKDSNNDTKTLTPPIPPSTPTTTSLTTSMNHVYAVQLMKLCLDEFPYWLRRIFKHEFNKKWSGDVGKWEDLEPNTRGGYLWNGCCSTNNEQDTEFAGMVEVLGKVFKTESKELQEILYQLPPGARIKIRVDGGSIQECTLQNIKKEHRVKIKGKINGFC